MSFTAKMPDDGFTRSLDETVLTLSLLSNVRQPTVEGVKAFGNNLFIASNHEKTSADALV